MTNEAEISIGVSFDKSSIVIASIETYMKNIKKIENELAALSFGGDNLANWQNRWQLEKILYNYRDDVLYFQVSFALFRVSLNTFFFFTE